MHAVVLGWPRTVGNLKGASALPAEMISGGQIEVRLVNRASSTSQAIEPQDMDDAAQAVSIVPAPAIRPGSEVATGVIDGSLPAEPAEPNPVIPGFPDVRYYTKRELSREPALAGSVNLDVPRGASAPVGGKVALRLWIGEGGGVENILVVRTNVPVIMTETALAAFKAARFQPGEINGQPVKSQLAIEVSFDEAQGPRKFPLTEPVR